MNQLRNVGAGLPRVGNGGAAAYAASSSGLAPGGIRAINKLTLIEIPIPGVAGGQTGTQFNFPDQPQLRYTALLGLRVYPIGAVPTGPSGTANISANNFKQCFLTLFIADPQNQSNQGEYIYRIPVVKFNDIVDGTDGYCYNVYPFVGQAIIYPQSYVTFAVGPANITNTSVIVEVNYYGTPGTTS